MSDVGWMHIDSEDGEVILYHTKTKAFINLSHSSNGWFRFIPSSGQTHKICWTAGNTSDQDFPSETAGTVSSLELGLGNSLEESSVFGNWKSEVDGHLLVLSNCDVACQKLVLTTTGFIFLGEQTATELQNGIERGCSRKEGEEKIKLAAEAAAEAASKSQAIV